MNFYTDNATALIDQYQRLKADIVHSAWVSYLPIKPGLALDIGAGSGRDALWLAEKGWQVAAIEPCDALRGNIPQHENIQIINASLPQLNCHLEKSYDLILVSAVWMHLTVSQQQQAIIRLQGLLNRGGLLIITWRNQAGEIDRQFETVNERVLRGAEIIETQDKADRAGVIWKCAIIKNEAGI